MSILQRYCELREGASLNIVIVGASGGIGAALITQLLEGLDAVHIYACSRCVTDHLSGDSRVTALALDYADESSIKQAAGAIKSQSVTLDLVIVCTGLLHHQTLGPEKALQQLQPENFLENITVNALGPALVAKHFLPLMSKKHQSFFGALSARVGSISDNGLGGWHSYRASKTALNMLLKNIAIEYRRKLSKLIVAGLHPGTVATPLSQPFQSNVDPEKLFTPEQAAQQLLTVINDLNVSDSGLCFAWDGQVISA